jgi:hypothetical protein
LFNRDILALLQDSLRDSVHRSYEQWQEGHNGSTVDQFVDDVVTSWSLNNASSVAKFQGDSYMVGGTILGALACDALMLGLLIFHVCWAGKQETKVDTFDTLIGVCVVIAGRLTILWGGSWIRGL